MSMSTPPDVADRFALRLVGSEDELLRALYFHNSILDKQFRVDLIFERDEDAREARALLLEAGASRADLRPMPGAQRLDASFHRRLATRVAHIAAEKGGRIEVPHHYPGWGHEAASPHHDPTDLRAGYVAPTSLVERAQGVAAVCEALRDTNLPLEYVITAEGEHKLIVGDGELSLDGLSAEDRKVFERFEDFLELTARLESLVG